MSTATGTTAMKGGAWLIEETAPGEVMTPEKRTEEHRLIEQTAAEFMDQEVFPVVGRLEQKEWALNRKLIEKCGTLGLLGTNIPEAYGGVDLDKVSTLIVSEQVSRYASFGATFGAQANLTILPIYMFGSEAQRQRYLPGLIAGEMVGAYCLSESGSGSDALGAKARAISRPTAASCSPARRCGSPTAASPTCSSSSPRWTASAFTAFIVEQGVARGVIRQGGAQDGPPRLVDHAGDLLQDVKVPADAVLGEIGKGHKVAFNVLNFGRFKLGAMASGGAKASLAEAAKYAATRKQFNVPIATFGAIKHKLGEMTAREYALESMMYRTAGLIDAHIAAADEQADRRRPDAEGAGGVRRRGVHRQGAGQRGGGLHHRRERADPRRQRVRERLPGRGPLPGCPRQSHLRGDQRDQPPADSRDADEEGGEGRARADPRREAAAGRDHEPRR